MTYEWGPLVPGRLGLTELCRIAATNIRARPLRTALSALGIAVGIAAVVSVLGLSASSQAKLLAEIDALGTNLLTVSTGNTVFGDRSELPKTAPAMISRIAAVTEVAAVGDLDVKVYRNPLIPATDTNGLSVKAAEPGVMSAVSGELHTGVFLNDATVGLPVAVLGAVAARRLGFTHIYPGVRVLIGNYWFYVAGILEPLPLAPELDRAVLVGFPIAESLFSFAGHPSTVYVRPEIDSVADVHGVLAATANPEHPNEVTVSQPSDALLARAQAQGVFNSLFLGLGVVVLLVGGLGVANIMIIAVLERRTEIGLRRAIGATSSHILAQFLGEAMFLSALGGVAGMLIGTIATCIYAWAHAWMMVIPPLVYAESMGAALLMGAGAGLIPAIQAARLAPTDALRTA